MRRIRFILLFTICSLTFLNSMYSMSFFYNLFKNLTKEKEEEQFQEQSSADDTSSITVNADDMNQLNQDDEDGVDELSENNDVKRPKTIDRLMEEVLKQGRMPGCTSPHSWGFDREEHNRQELFYVEEDRESLPHSFVGFVIENAPDGVIKELETAEDKNLKIREPLLFISGPGTGKSTVAKVVAQLLCETAGFKWKSLRGTQIVGEVQNSGQRNLRTVFSPIISANDKWIVTIDEVDNFIVRRHDSREIRDEEAVQEFNLILDRCRKRPNIVIICITNNLDLFPPALKSRFQQINFTLPDDESRKRIILYFLDYLQNQGLRQQGIHEDIREFRRYRIENCFYEEFIAEAVQKAEGMNIREIESALLSLVKISVNVPEAKERWIRRLTNGNSHEEQPPMQQSGQAEITIRQSEIIQVLQERKSSPSFLDLIFERIKEQAPELVIPILE